MSFRSVLNYINRLGEKKKADSTSSQRGGSFLQRIFNANSEENSLTIAAVYRAAELRSNSIASLRMRYMLRDSKLNYMREDLYLTGRKTNYVLSVRPNSRQNAFQFWKTVEMQRMMSGHCYILPIFGDDGVLQELIPCHGNYNAINNTYVLNEPSFGVSMYAKNADEIIVIRGIVTEQHPEGESIISYANRTMSTSATSEELSLESAAKGGRMKLILQQKGAGGDILTQLDPDEMNKQAQRLQESLMYDDVVCDNSGSTATQINMSMADLQLLESRKFSVSDIARFFGVPRVLLMDDSNSNYKSAEAASLEFLTRTLQPIIREIETEFDSKLLTQEEYGTRQFRFDISGLFNLDIATKVLHNKSRLETGVASVNELRAESNMPAIVGGDEHYVSCNVAPIGSQKLSGNITTQSQQ